MRCKTTITRNCEGEYIVKQFLNGVHQVDADYFTDDKDDAKETAKAMERICND